MSGAATGRCPQGAGTFHSQQLRQSGVAEAAEAGEDVASWTAAAAASAAAAATSARRSFTAAPGICRRGAGSVGRRGAVCPSVGRFLPPGRRTCPGPDTPVVPAPGRAGALLMTGTGQLPCRIRARLLQYVRAPRPGLVRPAPRACPGDPRRARSPVPAHRRTRAGLRPGRKAGAGGPGRRPEPSTGPAGTRPGPAGRVPARPARSSRLPPAGHRCVVATPSPRLGSTRHPSGERQPVALEILGLDGLSESVYRALLADPDADLDALARRLGVDGPAVRTRCAGWSSCP